MCSSSTSSWRRCSSPATISGIYSLAFPAAGSYLYRSTASKDGLLLVGAVTVPVTVAPSTGPTATRFTVTWSSSTISGYVFDVQSRFLKAGWESWTTWKPWQTGTSAAGGSFVPNLGAGTYSFIARVRNATTGNASGWSLETTLTVH